MRHERAEHERKEKRDVSSWENAFFQRPLKEDVLEWRHGIEIGARPIFQFYVACPEEKFKAVVDYIRQEVGVHEEDVIRIDIDPERQDISSQLFEIEDRIKEAKGPSVLIIARGFEQKMERLRANAAGQEDYRYSLTRLGHDFNQNLAESQENYRDWGKKIIIITHIAKTEAQNTYQDALRSAAGSQFRDGIVEIE